MEIRQLMYFIQIVKSGTYSAAAKQLYLSQPALSSKVKKVERNTFSIILTQGLNRQIRRMCEACGCQVKRLVRVRIMNIRLGNLRTGAYRQITKEEYEELTGLLKDSSSLSLKERKNQ